MSETPMSDTSKKPRVIVGFVCERSIPIAEMIDAQKALVDDPETRIVVLPCSGMVKPTQMELALAKGADATFVCGCAIGDCHYRTGNLMIKERLEGARNPKLRKATDRRKVGMFFYTMKDRAVFLDALAQFKAATADLK
ncbi:MAG TPA: hydrogenase iron-sulfur subunit [Holophagaceae bacterium]|nr:hydrogenase iron-sulfur subunit [Holophagaceae bacterium]